MLGCRINGLGWVVGQVVWPGLMYGWVGLVHWTSVLGWALGQVGRVGLTTGGGHDGVGTSLVDSEGGRNGFCEGDVEPGITAYATTITSAGRSAGSQGTYAVMMTTAAASAKTTGDRRCDEGGNPHGRSDN